MESIVKNILSFGLSLLMTAGLGLITLERLSEAQQLTVLAIEVPVVVAFLLLNPKAPKAQEIIVETENAKN